ncbi:expressed unknown protein [Seminavis robusta]|uniref:MYND-type domain-containing protein n=1 Tax=Seminavis robusta TaxID=568900 RepID=A0A9N8HJR0_9STRA|nr:expressed unknown protein [Seminavis robusta]|eukprot:Sro879_g214870.1 n/a (463) ;mRNA; f:25660-27048
MSAPDATNDHQDDDCQAAADEEHGDLLGWWEVTRKAETCGYLDAYSSKGYARKSSSRTVSFDWVFQPSAESVATCSPKFNWLDMDWNVRFQKSPFDSGIPHPPAWSLFLDLNPPYTKVHRVKGTIFLKHDTGNIQLWKFEEDFEPAFEHQEVCTWSRLRLDLHDYVQEMQGKDIILKVKLTAWGLGRDLSLQPMTISHEILPFTLKVGTKTCQRRFGWDIRCHLHSLSEDQVSFWKGLQADPKGCRKLRFGPRDLVNEIRNDHIASITTWKACSELKRFVVHAIHVATCGVAAIPYNLIFFDFDMMDGSNNDDDPRKEPWSLEYCSPDKHAIIHRLLDWIVEKPLKAAFLRINGHCNEKIFSTILEKESEMAELKAAKDTVQCVVCGKSGTREKLSTCSVCCCPMYCSRSCQRSHWKQGHKKECANLKREKKMEDKAMRVTERKLEERRAYDLVDDLMDLKF